MEDKLLLQKIKDHPHRVCARDLKDFGGKDYEKLGDAQQTYVNRALDTFASLAKSLITNEIPFYYSVGTEKSSFEDIDRLDLDFASILDLFEKSSLNGTSPNSADYFDITRAFATFYTVLWQTTYRRGQTEAAKQNPKSQYDSLLDVATDIFTAGRGVWSDEQALKNIFGDKWVITQRVAEPSNKSDVLYTGVILPVIRANPDEAKRTGDSSSGRYLGAVNEDVIKSTGKFETTRYATVGGWRVNREIEERRAYDGECFTPLWLNYQMACTNPRKTNFGHPEINTRVKDDFFKYDEKFVIKPALEKLPTPNMDVRSYTSIFGSDTNYQKPSGYDNNDRYPRAGGSLTRNAKHWQLFNHPLAWWNIVQPWKIDGENKTDKFLPWGTTKWFNKLNGDWDHVVDGDKADLGYGAYAHPGRAITMQHGSIYGTTYYDAPGSLRDPDQEGLLARGLLGKGQKSGAYNDLLSVVDIAYDWKKEKSSIPLDLVFSFLKGTAPTNEQTLESLGRTAPTTGLRFENALARNYFGFDRSPTAHKANFGGLAFALEPLKFVSLYEKNMVTPNSTDPTYVTAFYFFSWVLNIFRKAYSDNPDSLQSFLTKRDFPGFDHVGDGSNAATQLTNKHFQQNQLYIFEFLLNFIFALLEEAKDQYDKLGVSDLGDPELEIGLIGGGDDFNDAAKAQIIENAQCYMLNTIETWAQAHTDFSKGYNLEYQSILITKGNKSEVGNPAFPGTKCDHFLNLIGKRDETLAKLLDIKPADLALLQPRIRLYQQKRRINPKTGKEETTAKRVDIPGPFQTNVDTGAINKMLREQAGRMFGAGIKEININSEGGNKAMGVNSPTFVEIKFYFNRIEELFLNYPRYSTDAKGKIDFSNVEYPFGVTPGHTRANAPASIAELVFPPMINNGDLEYGKFADVQLQDFQIMLEYGWNIPQNFFKGGMTGDQKKIIDKLREKTLFKTFFLQPLPDSEFSMNQNGSIGLTVEYVAIPHSLMQAHKNKLFPSLFLADFPNERKFQEELAKLRKKIKELKEKEKQGVQSRNNTQTREGYEAEFKKKINNARDKKFADFLSRNVRQLFGYLMGLEKGSMTGIETQAVPEYRNKPVYHRILIPKSVLGVFDDVKKVRRWQPYRELGELSTLKTGRQNVPFRTGRTLDVGGPISTGNAFNDAGIVTGNAVRLEQQVKSLLKSRDKKTAIQYKKAQNAVYNQLDTDAFVTHDETSTVPIDFIYFGDLVEIIIEFVENDLNQSISGSESIKELIRHYADKINFVFGCLTIPNVKSDGTTRNVSIKVTDIPIVSNILVDFIINHIVKPEKYDISYVGFIIEFYRWFLRNYFSTKCFKGIREITTMHPEIQFFSMYSRPKLKGINRHALVKPATSNIKGIAYSKKEFAKLMNAYDKRQLKANKGKESTHFCYLGGQAIGEGSYDYKKDLKQNIHHFYIGKDSGLVKSIDFTASEIEGRREAVYSVVGDGLNKAIFMIPRIYDVTVTMIGNHLFEPGQTFFVNPTLGTTLSIANKKLSQSDILKNTGLGGYYYINKMESRMKAGLYETIIEGIKIGLSSEPAKTIVESISAEDLQASSLEEIKQEQEKLKLQGAGGDLLEQIENLQKNITGLFD